MQGLSDETGRIFEQISKLDCIKDYYLIGGTALALQTGHRLSEDLDFCKWQQPDISEINWPQILQELFSIFKSYPQNKGHSEFYFRWQ